MVARTQGHGMGGRRPMGRPLPRGRFGSTAARASAAVLAIAAGLALSAPAQAQTATTLVSNASEFRENNSTTARATSFTTGSNADGYTITEIQVWYGSTTLANPELSVKLYTDDSGEPGTIVAEFTDPPTRTENALNTFTAPAGTTVSVLADSTYWVVANEGLTSAVTLGRTAGTGETGATGWSIGDAALFDNGGDWATSQFLLLMVVKGTITGVVTTPVTIEAEHDSIGGGLEDLDFTLTRTGATTAELDATVTITQDESWLGATDLSHDVTFAADSATTTLTIGWSKFSYAPTSTGTLTATVSGTGITGGSDDVEVISISEPPITFSYDKASYTFAEDATNDSVYVVATLNAAYPRLPSIRTITASFSTRGGTADSAPGGTGDFKAISWMPGLSQSEYARAADTDPWVARYAVPDFEIHDDEVYDEGSETFTMIIEGSPGSDFDQVQFAYSDGTTCGPCSPIPAYTVTITDNDNIPPVLSLSVDPSSIDDEDQLSTVDVLENVSIVTVETTNDTTFARDTTLTLTFGGTATQGTHYSVLPEDADLVATGYQVVMPHDADSVEVTVTALRNTSADGDRTVTVAGAIAGTSIAGSGTITIRNVETPVPGAPTGLTATADGTGTIDLAWTAPAEDGGSAITGYRIEVSSDGGGSWTDLEDDTGDTGTTYSHTGLSAGTTRHYRVSAINANGTGSPSGTAAATTDPAAAALVSNTGQTDGGAHYPGVSPGNTKWSHAIGFVTGDAAGGYTLSSVQAQVGLDDATSSVQVSIYEANTSGEPDGSLYVLTTPSSISTTVTLLTFTAPAQATLAKETTYFVVFEAPTGQVEVTATAANAEDAGKASGWSINNLPYSRNNDATPWSENTSSGARLKPEIAVIGTTNPTAPGAPTNLTATADGSTRIDLAWTAPSDNGGSAITGYKIEVSSDGTTWTDLVASNTGTTYPHTGLPAGTTRHYRVSAINAHGTSAASDTASATTDAGTITTTTLVSNTGKTSIGALNLRDARYAQGFTAGTDANVSSVELDYDSGSLGTGTLTVTLNSEASGGDPGAVLATLTNPASLVTGLNTFTDPANTALTSGETYFIVLGYDQTSGGPLFRVTSADGEDSGGVAGWTIGDSRYNQSKGSSNWSTHTSSLKIKVNGTSTTTTTVPGAPTDLTATADGATEIDLAWNAPTDDGGSAITGYKIEVSSDGGTVWTDLVASNTGTTYSHTGLTAGTTRHYRVSAINANGTGNASGTASATTATTVPGVPTSLTATADGSTEIDLAWTAPSDNGGAAITGYKIEVSSDGSTWTDLVANNAGTTYSHTGLSPGTTRHYRVSAINTNGTGNASGTANATTATTVPGTPTSLTATASGTGTINLSWTAPSSDGGSPITGYRIEVSPNGTSNWTNRVANTNSTGTTHSHTGLSAGTTRHYRVSAINVNGTGNASSTANATTATTVPGEPTSLTATASGTGTINLSWSAPSDDGGSPITGYRIEVSPDGNSNWTNRVANTNSTGTTHSHTGLSPGTTRHYRVSAINVNGTGTASGTTNATTNTTATNVPGPPTGLTATASGTGTINLSWTAPSDDGGSAITGYRIEVSPDGTSNWTNRVANTNSTGTTHSHTGLSPGTTRHYRVSAINTNGTGNASGTANATTATTVPGAPTSLTATASGTGTINLSWSAPTDDGGSPITGYRIEVSPNGASNWSNRVANTNSTGTTYSHTGLSGGTTRHYRVSAINVNGTGNTSGTANATTNTAATNVPGAPTGLTATASGTRTIDLSWTAPSDDGGSPITGYRIEVSSDGGSNWTDRVANTNSTGTTYAHTGLSGGTTRHYRVSAINANGTGNASGTANATTATNPRAVRNVRVDVVVDPNVPKVIQDLLGPNKIMALRVDWDPPNIPIDQVRGWLIQWGKVRNCDQSPPKTWDGPNLWFKHEAPPMYYRPAGSAPARYFRVAVAITGGMENGPWSAPVCGDISAASAAADRADAADGDDALEEALAKIVDGLTPDEAAGALFGDVRLSEARLAALDLLGNGNGRYDLGDLLAWIDRCKRGEARCGATSADSPPPAAAGLAAAAATRRPRRRTGRRGSGRKGRTPLRTARRHRGRLPGYALAALLAAATTLSCADGPVGPAAVTTPDPGFLTVEWSGPEAGRGTGVLLELEGPGIETVRAPGFELYESSAPGPQQIVVAGPLEAGPLAQFRVPDRNQSALYRVRVIEVTGDDYQLRDPREYRAVVITN